MRYLEIVEDKVYRLINDRKQSVDIVYQNKKIVSGVGTFEFNLSSEQMNPIVQLIYEDRLIEYVGVQHITGVGITNFRDIGGYINEDGKQIKFREFYRSAVVCSKGKELEKLNTLNIKTILDLRSTWEVNKEPDVDVKNADYIHCSAMTSMDDFVNSSKSLNIADLEKQFVKSDPREMMKTLYKDLIFSNSAYKEMFEILEKRATPIMFHCSAGKDRTGIAAALIMLALGVDRGQVESEYLLTNVYRKHLIDAFAKEKGVSVDEAESVVGVKKEYIDFFFETIDKKYKNIDEYLEKEYGLTKEKRDKLKEFYTI